MKKYISIIAILLLFINCKNEQQDPKRFKSGTFEIPAGDGFDRTTIVRVDSLQIETYDNKTDTLYISWKNNFNYTLKMLHPTSAIDEDLIHVKITSISKNSYTFEAVIGHSNFVQKGELTKISN
ncbi:MAG: hypothetical protein KBE41_09200 [Lutibacter sp.]|nr:hypothetical protein [Lutibacter sp.]